MSGRGPYEIHVLNQSGRRVKKSLGLPTRVDLAPSTRSIRHIVQITLEELNIEQGEVSVVLVTDHKIKALNKEWRGKDKATNVLSFPTQGNGSVPSIPGNPLGDVVVSLDTVVRQGAETGSGYPYTFAFYLVHGILHLTGWDHDSPTTSRKMRRKTHRILEEAGLKT